MKKRINGVLTERNQSDLHVAPTMILFPFATAFLFYDFFFISGALAAVRHLSPGHRRMETEPAVATGFGRFGNRDRVAQLDVVVLLSSRSGLTVALRK